MKFLIIIVGILSLILGMCKYDFSSGENVVENWWGGTQFTTGAMPAVRKPNGEMVAIAGNYLDPNMMGSGKFVSTPGFQAVISPRFSNVQYGANIRYNMPDRENQAVPCEPLTFGSMAQENYMKQRGEGIQQPIRQVSKENYGCGSGGGAENTNPPSCGKGGYGFGHKLAGGYELPSNYAAGNYWDVYDSIPGGKVIGGDLPVGTMTTMDGAGNIDQVVVAQHIMPMNTKSGSRLYAQGDKIRGDLPIVPCQNAWFSVYPNISRDISEGALNVLAGVGGGGESYNKLMNLIVSASGGTQTALGGADLSNTSMMTSMPSGLSAGMGDIVVSAFP